MIYNNIKVTYAYYNITTCSKYLFVVLIIITIIGFTLSKQVRHFPDHIIIYIPVSGECPGSFFVSGEFADKVGIFDLFVEIPDKCSAGEV